MLAVRVCLCVCVGGVGCVEAVIHSELKSSYTSATLYKTSRLWIRNDTLQRQWELCQKKKKIVWFPSQRYGAQTFILSLLKKTFFELWVSFCPPPPRNSLLPCLLIVPPLLFMIFANTSLSLWFLTSIFFSSSITYRATYGPQARRHVPSHLTVKASAAQQLMWQKTKKRRKIESRSTQQLFFFPEPFQSLSQLSWRWLSCHHVIKVFLTFTSFYKRFKLRESAKYHLNTYSMYAHWNYHVPINITL